MSDDWRTVLLKDYRPACTIVVNDEPRDGRNIRTNLDGVFVNARGYPLNRTDETVVGRWYAQAELTVELPASDGPRRRTVVKGSLFVLLTDHSLRASVFSAKREASQLGAFTGASEAKDKIRVLVFEWPYANMDSVSMVTGLERAVGIGGGQATLVVNTASECKPNSWSFKLRSNLRGFSEQLQAAITAHRPDLAVEHETFSGGMLGREQQATFAQARTDSPLGIRLGATPGNRGWPVVESIEAAGAAERAGLLVGDELAGVNGRQVHNIAEVVQALQGKQPGDTVTLICFRSGERYRLVSQLNAAA